MFPSQRLEIERPLTVLFQESASVGTTQGGDGSSLSSLCSSTVTTFAKLFLINLAKLYYTLDNYYKVFFRLLRNNYYVIK